MPSPKPDAPRNPHRITIYIRQADEGLWLRVRQEAERTGVSPSALVADVLRDRFGEEEE